MVRQLGGNLEARGILPFECGKKRGALAALKIPSLESYSSDSSFKILLKQRDFQRYKDLEVMWCGLAEHLQ